MWVSKTLVSIIFNFMQGALICWIWLKVKNWIEDQGYQGASKIIFMISNFLFLLIPYILISSFLEKMLSIKSIPYEGMIFCLGCYTTWYFRKNRKNGRYINYSKYHPSITEVISSEPEMLNIYTTEMIYRYPTTLDNAEDRVFEGQTRAQIQEWLVKSSLSEKEVQQLINWMSFRIVLHQEIKIINLWLNPKKAIRILSEKGLPEESARLVLNRYKRDQIGIISIFEGLSSIAGLKYHWLMAFSITFLMFSIIYRLKGIPVHPLLTASWGNPIFLIAFIFGIVPILFSIPSVYYALIRRHKS